MNSPISPPSLTILKFKFLLQVFVWGSNSEGQLGLGPEKEDSYYSPQLLELDFQVYFI